MKKVIFIFFCIVFTSSLYSQWINQSYTPIPFATYYESKFLDSNVGFLVGGNGNIILKTTNGGNNWAYSSLGNGILSGVDFKDLFTGLVVGTYNSTKFCYKTTSGGDNWFSRNFPVNKGFYSIKFISQSNVICAGDSGLVLKSTNAGDNWTVIQTPTNQTFSTICIADSNHFFACGTNGMVMRTTNGGTNWELLTSGTTTNLLNIFFINNNIGFITGSSGALVKKTTNGGLSWSNVNLGSTVDVITSVYFPSLNIGYVTGFYLAGKFYQNVIFKTTNGGTSWTVLPTPPQNFQPLYTIFFVNNNLGWFAGANSLILKTTNGGLTYINGNNATVSNFNLEQNYPNPFNPSTIINYQLTINSFVTLNVYDVNGRLVKELVNSKQSAGNYSITFDGSGLPSGTYVYRLQAGEFSETKKMVLLK